MGLTQFLTDNAPILLVCAVGLAAVYLLLPRPRRLPVMAGSALAVLALLLAGWLVVRPGGLTLEGFLFYVFAVTAVGAGGLLVTQQNPARAALSFALVILSTCGLFLIEAAPFLMAATIIIYAGAIIVMFLFILMLAQQEGPSDADARSREPFLATVTGFLLLATLLYVLRITYKPDLDRWAARTAEHLARVERLRAQEKTTAEERDALTKDLRAFYRDFRRWWEVGPGEADEEDGKERVHYPSGGKALSDALTNFERTAFVRNPEEDSPQLRLNHLATVEAELRKLHEAAVAMRNNPLLGSRRPRDRGQDSSDGDEGFRRAMSEASGPRSSRRLEELRRDEWGRPRMPAENTAYLGRSLFSDYLLSVELAGLLLLVATVGAIIIAQRRPLTPTPLPPGERGRGEGAARGPDSDLTQRMP